MNNQLTVKQASRIARSVHAAVNRSADPREIDWNDRINDILANVDLGWELRRGTYIDGLDCQFIGALAKTIRSNAVEKFGNAA